VIAVAADAPVFESTTKTVYVAFRAVGYSATAIFFGGLVFIALLWPSGAGNGTARRTLCSGWLLGTLATISALAVEGAWAAGRPASSAVRVHVLDDVLATDFGRQWAVLVLLWVLALVVLADLLRRGEAAARSLPWRVGAGTVALGALRVYGLTGHSRQSAHPVVGQLADVAHLAAITVWIGGLVMLVLGVLPRRRPEELAAVLPRYSNLAVSCVAVAVTSGVVLAWNDLPAVSDLATTTYGRILLVKLAVLALVLAAAFGSKTWVEHRLDFVVILRGEGSITTSAARLVRPAVLSVAVETGLLLLVLSVASVLVTADPGR
jgi:putative copper export protein